MAYEYKIKEYFIQGELNGTAFSQNIREWTAQRAFRKMRRQYPNISLMKAEVIST